MTKRKRLPAGVEETLLVRSGRRCCICFGLHRQVRVTRGQIAHLDGNSGNNGLSNLAYLCLKHHDAYDSRGCQSKGFTAREVRAYRAELYRAVVPVLEQRARVQRESERDAPERDARAAPLDGLDGSLLAERQAAIQELLERSRSVRGHTVLAHELGLPAQTVERLLARLGATGLVRIDREPGTLRKTYSLAASAANRLLDTFVSSLGGRVSTESRYVRRGIIEVDAVVKGKDGAYLIDTLLVKKRPSDDFIARRVHSLLDARVQLRFPAAKCVLLVGITTTTAMASPRLRSFERRGLVVRYVDLGPA